MAETDFPVHDSLDVIDGETIFKSDEWWKAAVVYERYGRRIGIYLWNWRDDEDRWVRKQKYVIKSVEEWETERQVVDSFLPVLEGDDRAPNSGSATASQSGASGSGSTDGPDVDDLMGDLLDLPADEGEESGHSPTNREGGPSSEIDCPVSACAYTGPVKSVAGHVSGKHDNRHDWKRLGFEGAVEFRRAYADD